MSKIKMPSVSELMRRFEAKHGHEPTAEELSNAWFSGELDTPIKNNEKRLSNASYLYLNKVKKRLFSGLGFYPGDRKIVELYLAGDLSLSDDEEDAIIELAELEGMR